MPTFFHFITVVLAFFALQTMVESAFEYQLSSYFGLALYLGTYPLVGRVKKEEREHSLSFDNVGDREVQIVKNSDSVGTLGSIENGKVVLSRVDLEIIDHIEFHCKDSFVTYKNIVPFAARDVESITGATELWLALLFPGCATFILKKDGKMMDVCAEEVKILGETQSFRISRKPSTIESLTVKKNGTRIEFCLMGPRELRQELAKRVLDWHGNALAVEGKS